MSYTDENGVVMPLGQRLGIVKFPNRHGLESVEVIFIQVIQHRERQCPTTKRC